MKFEVDDWVYLKASPMKGVIMFGKKEKLGSLYIGPCRFSNRVGNVAYELELPQKLAAVYPVFHVSIFKKCLGDPLLVVLADNVGIKDILSYEEVIVQILNHHVRKS